MAGEDETLAATAGGHDTAFETPLSGKPIARGELVGRYVVLAKLGQGGMGVVYAAYDPELDRKVALKLLHPGEGERKTESRARLLREAQAMAKLAHPNVITVHDVGTHAERVFVAMEFVEGGTLTEWLQNDHSWQSVLDVFVRAGQGLVAAHAAGLIHRDFKPDNVMIGQDGRVRVMDFGLARSTAAAESPESKDSELVPEQPTHDALTAELTRKGSTLGTPAYMAPEQHLGRATDARTDQFSYCVALWEGLFRERPFRGETLAALALDVTEGKLRPPGGANNVPSWLRGVVERGLVAAPDDRWPDMSGLLAVLAGGAARRRRVWMSVAALGLIATGLGAVGVRQLDLESRRAQCLSDAGAIAELWTDDAKTKLREGLVGTGVPYAETTFAHAVPYVDDHVAEWQAHYARLCLATEVDESRSNERWAASQHCLDERRGELSALIEVLSVGTDAAAVRRTVSAFARLAKVDPCADDSRLRRIGPTIEGGGSARDLRDSLWRAKALDLAGSYDAGLALADSVCDATVEHPNARLRAKALELAGSLAEATGDYAKAETQMRASFGVALAAGEDDLAAIAATQLVNIVGARAGQPEAGLTWGSIAAGLQARTGADEDLAVASLRNSLGNVYKAQGRFAEAERVHREALAIFEKVEGPTHPSVAALLNNVGTSAGSLGRYAEAEQALNHSIEIFVRTLGPDHPDVATSYNNLGTEYLELGRYADAERAFDKALAIRRKALGPDHPRVAMSHGSLGNVYRSQGRFDEAEQETKTGLAIFERSLGPNHPHVATSHDNLGGIYRRQQRYEEAAREHATALAMRERTLGPNHLDVAASINHLALVYRAQGRYLESESAHSRALSIREHSLGPEHRNVAISLVGRSAVRLVLDRPAEALSDAERALAIATRQSPDLSVLAGAQFVIAQSLWATQGNLARARALAKQALDGYRRMGKAEAGAVADVERWLARHRERE